MYKRQGSDTNARQTAAGRLGDDRKKRFERKVFGGKNIPPVSYTHLARQRGTVREQLRIADLMSLTPKGKRVLEIGARDCYLSRKLTALYPEVVALDLTKPEIDAPGITAVQGDVTGLRFANNAFDTVFCTEVLEHVPPEKLQQACNEIVRVASRYACLLYTSSRRPYGRA